MFEDFLPLIAAQYQLEPGGPHGLSHWGRVLINGLNLAEETEADRQVVSLFAIFHDACRINDSFDPGHGRRGADLAVRLFSIRDDPVLNDRQIDLLIAACSQHTDGLTEADITVQTCWDADRLDLARVSIQPKPRYLCTQAAKDPDVILEASDRARRRFTPAFVRRDWIRWFGVDGG